MNLISPWANAQALFEFLRILRRHFELTWEMTKRELTDRYAGQAIGMLWTLGHPLAQIAVYVFIFSHVFKVRMVGMEDIPFDYTAYILSGLVPWLTFNEVLGKASQTISANSNLVKQVVFPLEVLPVKTVLASFVTQLICMALVVVYVWFTSQTLSWSYAFLPILFFFQVVFMIGICFFLSALGPYFRDLKEFVTIFCLISVYLMPIVYQPTNVPEIFQPVLYLNPFSYMIWCYQDACYFARFEHPWAWPIFIAMSIATFVLGYRVFRKLKPFFGNVL